MTRILNYSTRSKCLSHLYLDNSIIVHTVAPNNVRVWTNWHGCLSSYLAHINALCIGSVLVVSVRIFVHICVCMCTQVLRAAR